MEFVISGETEEALAESLSKCIETLNADLQQQLMQANEAGDYERANEIGAQQQEKTQELMDEYTSKLQRLQELVEKKSTSPYQFPCKIDLDLTVYDGDRDSYLEFEGDPDICKAREEYNEKVGVYNSRKNLLKSSLRLTPAIAPNVYEIGKQVKETLGIEANLEFYVYQNDRFNASVYPPRENDIYIMLTSSILEKFTDDELTFVIGHELGHTLFNHHKYNANALLDIGQSYLSPLHAVKLFSWGRSAEISADRVGLLCCKSFVSAAKAFFKLSSGVTTDTLAFKLDEYVKQFSDLSAEMAQDSVSPEDWYSSHPFSPLRIKALDIFNRSKTFQDLGGQCENWELTEEEMENEIAQFMSLMDPSYLNDDNEVGEKIHRFMFLSGYLISLADGNVDESELHALGKIVSPEVFKTCMDFIKDKPEEEIRNEVIAGAETLNIHLSVMQKLNLIRDLSIIASADGEIHQGEVHVLYNVCHVLKIQPEFVDQVLHGNRSTLD